MTNNSVIVSEIDKIASLTSISEEQRKELSAAVQYTTIPYMPITTPFIEKYILNNEEYPIMESKLSQAAIEMKSRINRLVDDQFNIHKIDLDIEEIRLDIEDVKNDKMMPENRQRVQIAKKELDIKQKTWQKAGYITNCELNYTEFSHWKTAIEDCISEIQKGDPSIKSLADIDFDQVRMREMFIKVEKWKAKQAMGQELTPSQRVLTGD